MRILFVCGSLEPGHDGVGDYTRELAGALSHLEGVEAQIISIQDRSADGVKEEIQNSRNNKVKVKRLDEKLSFNIRGDAYRQFVEDFKPDWISLQYVPFAFSTRGLPFDLLRFLSLKNDAVKWHFMIHEAYVWYNLNTKRKILKHLEIRILKKLVRKLNPRVIHTTNRFYQKLLQDISIASDRMGLFGNIAILNNAESIEKSEVKQGIFFGAGPVSNHFSKFSEGIKNLMVQSPQPLKIVFCGRPDFRTNDFVKHLKSEFSSLNVEIEEIGALENEALSRLLLQSHFGISREPPQIMGKSGTVAVMLEHGLPLWVPLAENEDSLKNALDFRIEQCIIDLNEIFEINADRQFLPKSRIEEISNQFYTSLQNIAE